MVGEDPMIHGLLGALSDHVFLVDAQDAVVKAWHPRDFPVETSSKGGPFLCDMFDADANEAIRRALQQARASMEPFEVEFQCFHDGALRKLRARASAMEDGSAFVVIRNMTEILRHESEARVSEDSRKLLLEAIPDPIFHLDANGVYLGYNAQDPASLYAKPEDFIGKSVIEVLPPDIANTNLMAITAALESGQVQTFVYRSPSRDRYFEVRVVPAPGSQVVQIVRDITRRKQAEEELDRRVRARTVELEAANRELEAFCYSASHDLRTPLRSINGFSKLLAEDLGEALPPTIGDYIERIRRATLRMDSIINDMLKLAGVVRVPMTREMVDLSAMAALIFEDLADDRSGRDISFFVQPGLMVYADGPLLRLAMENLLSNAWKFTSKKATAQIEVGRDADSFYVRDNGVGFDGSFRSRMFLPFERLHAQTEFPGNGIGLATVRRIIERHGGTISATSAPGEGATFRFTLDP